MGGGGDDRVAVADAAVAQALEDGEPGADPPLEDPDRCQQRGRGGKDGAAAGATAAALGGGDRESGRGNREGRTAFEEAEEE